MKAQSRYRAQHGEYYTNDPDQEYSTDWAMHSYHIGWKSVFLFTAEIIVFMHGVWGGSRDYIFILAGCNREHY